MHINRRTFARLSLASGLAALLGACRGKEEVPAPPAPPTLPVEAQPTGTVGPARYQEAPMLAEQVARGELPPVAERLPTKPLVLEPNASLGQYGGGLRSAMYTGPACLDVNVGIGMLLNFVLARPLVAFGQDLALRPSLAESWEYDESGTQLTFHLRQGVRWSDGAPFTTEDILFFLNYYPQRPPAGDRVVAADDHTIMFRWEQPEPQYLTNFAWSEQHWPAHALKPYHIAFSEDAFLRLNQRSAKERLGADYDDWVASGGLERIAGSIGAAEEERWAAMFLPLTANRQPGRPVLGPWVVEGEPGCRRIALRRNPYFWQVDPEGRQLPYLDRVVFDGVEDAALFRAAFANGEVDLQALGLTAGDLPWLRDHEADGDYRARTLPSTWHLTLHLNLATADERLSPFFNDLRVRQAVMLGIDRERLNFEFYGGLCTARQFSPLKGTRFYDEGISQGYVAYDVDAANALLDEAGYGERDSEGYRMHPNGERVAFEIAGATQGGSAEEACAEEVAGYLRDLGLECSYRRVPAGEMNNMLARNGIQAAWMPDYSFPVLPTRAAYTFLGFGINQQPWAAAYGYYWYITNTGASGRPDQMIEPPAGHWIWDLWRMYDEMGEETDVEKWEEGFRRLMGAWAEQVPVIGILGEMPQPVVVHNDLRNYVDELPYDEQVGGITLQNLQQLYWEHPERHVVEE